jgi:hypothetical protein
LFYRVIEREIIKIIFTKRERERERDGKNVKFEKVESIYIYTEREREENGRQESITEETWP